MKLTIAQFSTISVLITFVSFLLDVELLFLVALVGRTPAKNLDLVAIRVLLRVVKPMLPDRQVDVLVAQKVLPKSGQQALGCLTYIRKLEAVLADSVEAINSALVLCFGANRLDSPLTVSLSGINLSVIRSHITPPRHSGSSDGS